MVGAALEALVGQEPSPEAVAAALTTVPAAELPDALRLLARKHGSAGVPLLRRCLHARPDWAIAAAEALATVPDQSAADALAEAERGGPPKAVRTAVRRALYRLRQAGVAPAPEPPAPRRAKSAPVLRQAWVSAVDGTGSRGCWLVLEGPFGERTLLSAALNDVTGILEFAGGPIAKKRLDERLRAIRAESPLPWVEAPPGWAVHLLGEASRRHTEAGTPLPGELERWLPLLPEARAAAAPPIYARIPPAAVADDPALLEASAGLLELPELAGWFLEPEAVQSDALERLQARESRLVVSDEGRREREDAIVRRVVERELGRVARRRWARRLLETALVFDAVGREEHAGLARAAAAALLDERREAWHVPFARALATRALDVAGEVSAGRISAAEVSRKPVQRPG